MTKLPSHASMEVAKTVLEAAWKAVEHCHRKHPETKPFHPENKETGGDSDIESLQSENQRLRILLDKNLTILHQILSAPNLSQTCPSALHDQLLAAMNSESFLNELESLKEGAPYKSQFEDPSDLGKAEVLIQFDNEDPSLWVLVSDEMAPRNVEEKSGIDSDDYVIISEEHVVDGVANFMAKCILANPKALNLTPQELQKAIMKSLTGMNKVEKMLNIWNAGTLFYTLATCGLDLAGLYQGRAILRLAAVGAHHSTKRALRAVGSKLCTRMVMRYWNCDESSDCIFPSCLA